MRRILLMALVISLYSQPAHSTGTGPQIWGVALGDLPTTCSPGRTYTINDGADVSDCSSGGGSALVFCTCNTSGNGYEALDPSSGGGGAIFTFKTHDAPAGTDPVADSTTDTLTWGVTSPLVLTGDSSADSMTFSWSGTFPDAQISQSSVTQHLTDLDTDYGDETVTSTYNFTGTVDVATLDVNTWIRIVPQATAPIVCGASSSGTLYTDSDGTDSLCFCDGSSWRNLNGGSGCDGETFYLLDEDSDRLMDESSNLLIAGGGDQVTDQSDNRLTDESGNLLFDGA